MQKRLPQLEERPVNTEHLGRTVVVEEREDEDLVKELYREAREGHGE